MNICDKWLFMRKFTFKFRSIEYLIYFILRKFMKNGGNILLATHTQSSDKNIYQATMSNH